MYIRFITSFTNAYGERETGFFQAVGYLRRTSSIESADLDELHTLLDWFCDHLPPPDQFTKRRNHKESGTAISWYRDTAKEYIANMYAMSKILEKYGILSSVVKREDPGYIVYEDDIQVAAIPYREDREKVV